MDEEIAKEVFVVCPKDTCNALYKEDDPIRVCNHRSYGKVCGTSLGHYTNLSHGKRRWKPFKRFQFIPPSASLKKMFQSKEFVKLLEQERKMEMANDVIEDVQDGEIWKEFARSNYFDSKYNLALMLNVDWFRPFKRSNYKVAAIMLTVLNLPREERSKKRWTIICGMLQCLCITYMLQFLFFCCCCIILGIIPGPHEPSVHVNNFLEPLVKDLLELWDGVPLYEGCSQNMKAALLCVTSDLPALRKVTQFLGHKADLGCSRCKFRGEREPGTAGASGRMSYFTSGNHEKRSHNQIIQQGREYLSATTKARAANIAQKNGVRFSELLKLPYFDIVRMSVTDPMHTFLLGMVKRETVLNLRLLSSSQREEFIRRVKSIRMPYDVGRLPSNIFDSSDEMNGVTADQWKTYIITYARPCLYKLLTGRPYDCLVLLSQIITMMASPVFDADSLSTLYRLIHEHHNLFCRVYGKWSVTVNYHMSLHLTEMISDVGPPQSFWCFGYERLNGVFAGTPNSNRCIEVANRLLREAAFSNTDAPAIDVSVVPHPLKEFISSPDDDHFPPYPHTFHLLSLLSNTGDRSRFEVQQDLDRGLVEDWPVHLNYPTKKNFRCHGILLAEMRSFFEDLYGNGLDYLVPRIDKYGRCEVNGQSFSSDFNSTDRGSIVKVMFVDGDDELTPYFGIVRYYFTATTMLNHESFTHQLAYVTWLKFRHSSPEPLSKLYGVTKDLYRKDRILSPRRFLRRCVLVSPNHAVPFSLVAEL